jgi:hypothetical protein
MMFEKKWVPQGMVIGLMVITGYSIIEQALTGDQRLPDDTVADLPIIFHVPLDTTNSIISGTTLSANFGNLPGQYSL